MKRSEIREQAFYLVFENLFETNENIDELIQLYDENVCKVDDYAKDILNGVLINKEKINELINQFSNGWKITRLPKTTVAILYVAIYEIIFISTVPNSVAINEAVELAKKFGTTKDSAFINGLLGAIARSI